MENLVGVFLLGRFLFWCAKVFLSPMFFIFLFRLCYFALLKFKHTLLSHHEGFVLGLIVMIVLSFAVCVTNGICRTYVRTVGLLIVFIGVHHTGPNLFSYFQPRVL